MADHEVVVHLAEQLHRLKQGPAGGACAVPYRVLPDRNALGWVRGGQLPLVEAFTDQLLDVAGFVITDDLWQQVELVWKCDRARLG
jgi:hypothetical protein